MQEYSLYTSPIPECNKVMCKQLLCSDVISREVVLIQTDTGLAVQWFTLFLSAALAFARYLLYLPQTYHLDVTVLPCSMQYAFCKSYSVFFDICISKVYA